MTKLPFYMPSPLRGAEIGSFAHDTVIRRMPTTVRRVVAENDLEPEIAQAVLALADAIPHTPIRLVQDPGAPDLALWEAYAAPYLGQNWLTIPWFFAETYMYRRILEATGYFQPGSGFHADPYTYQKERGLEETSIGQDQPDIKAAILAALWGNQADLSLWPVGESDGPGGAHLLADDTDAVVAHLTGLAERQARVDLVLDNAGAELVHDLILADTLLANGLRLVLHAKPHPTFVSDAIIADVHTTIRWLTGQTGYPAMAGAHLTEALADGQLSLRDDWYWTSPLPGWELPAALRADLHHAELLISKGDANYRRWFGDRHWDFNTPLNDALAYLNTPILLIRACKSDVAVGLNPARSAEAAAHDPQWLTGGRWGVIQFYLPTQPVTDTPMAAS